MLRFVQFIVLVAVLAAGAVGFTLLLSHGPAGVPERLAVGGLGAPATAAWFDDGSPLRVEAATTDDALRALGYALAEEDAWSMLVWRQAARGRLAEWLGASVLPQDRHVRQLGISRGADVAAANLDSLTRRRLDAFCAGVNAAFATRRVARGAEVTLLGVAIEPWSVADVLASERLAAWIATDAPAAPFASVAFGATANADARLRRLIAADALGASRAWTFADDAPPESGAALRAPTPRADSARGPGADSAAATDDSLRIEGPQARLVATFVTGAQARPMLRAAEVRVAGQPPRLLMLLPGTPFPVAGALLDADGSAQVAWAVLPRGEASWQPVPLDADADVRAERMLVLGGQESVLYAPEIGGTTTVLAQPRPVRRLVPRDTLARPDSLNARVPGDSARLPAPPQAPADTADTKRGPVPARRPVALDTVVTQGPVGRWRIAWGGDEASGSPTDAAAWLSLWDARPAPMRLVRADGLVATRTGTVPLGGAAAHRRGLVAADSAARTALAARLDSLVRLPEWPSADAVRPAARRAAQALASRVDPRRLTRPIERAALETLRSWDGSYDANSVGATLFEGLSEAERARTGRDAFAAARDSAYFGGLRRTAAFQDAVRVLTRRYGAGVTDWRWGAARPQERRFAFWGQPGLDLPAAARYAPLPLPGGGHPLALAYGPAEADGAATTAEADLSLTPGVPVRLWAAPVDVDRLLGRYRASTDGAAVALTAGRVPASQTALVPL